MKVKLKNPSATASRSLPSFCIGFIALVLNSYKSWSFPTRAKLAKLSRLLNRLSQKDSSISLFQLQCRSAISSTPQSPTDISQLFIWFNNTYPTFYSCSKSQIY